MIRKDIYQCESIYDIMAVSYKYIIKNEKNAFLEFKSKPEYSKNIDSLVKLYNEEMKTGEAFSNFLNSIEEIFNKNSSDDEAVKAFCAALIIHIDDKFLFEHHPPRFSKKVSESIKGLNKKFTDEVIILPKYNNNFLSIGSYNSTLRNNKGFRIHTVRDLKNFVILKKSDLEDYTPVLNLYNNGKAIRLLAENRGLKVGLVPLTNYDLLDIKYVGETFEVKGFKNNYEEKLQEKYIKTLDKAEELGIDILIYPEMLLRKNIYETIKKHMREKISAIKFIFCGSAWENNSNKCYAISGNGEDIFIQSKFTPFKYKGKYLEHFKYQQSDMNIELLDIDGIGRMITTICIDYLDDSVMNRFMREFACNFSIVPAYSESLSKFEGQSKVFADDYHGITFVSNCCEPIYQKLLKQPGAESENLGLVCIPAINGRKPDAKHYFYGLSSGCAGKCEEMTCIHVFQLSFEGNNMIVNYSNS